jgi:hypothetical protein
VCVCVCVSVCVCVLTSIPETLSFYGQGHDFYPGIKGNHSNYHQ